MMRILNLCIIVALVVAAGYVYRIKLESTREAERAAKLRMEIRRQHDAIAALRAEWARLDTPARIQQLARRHLALQPLDLRQLDRFDNLPERPAPQIADADPIARLIEEPDLPDHGQTGSLPAAGR
jgi:cell division protein FtsL